MNNSFAIGIPTLNRVDLLTPALIFYLRDFPKVHIYVVDNGNQGIKQRLGVGSPYIHIINNETNRGVSASWNQLCDAIFENHSHALILNDDIYMGSDTAEILELILRYKGFMRSTQDWCSFLISKSTYKTVGRFDENFFPAYYEDNDYEYRLKLEKIPVQQEPKLNPYMYRSNSTSEKDKNVKINTDKNRQYYVNKWGGAPNKETYNKPFNPNNK